MAYPVISTETESHSWLVVKSTITATLVELDTPAAKFGVYYDAKWSGAKSGSTSGGPIPVTGNDRRVVNANPKTTVVIDKYADTGHSISMHIQVQVDAGGLLGTKTVFDKTLHGNYPAQGWQGLVASLEAETAGTTDSTLKA